ncbi:hypothetical protein LEP1GSC037_4540 [Leptospira interrogans str. 2006001854]|nr:hypothetical protein LEP1GSC037_4540 [Leptospira interrogans str. 2006001854]
MIHSALLDLGKNSNFEFYLFSHKDLHSSYSNLLNLPGIRFIKGEGFFLKKEGSTLLLPFHFSFEKSN